MYSTTSLRELREALGLSQDELASGIGNGLHQATVSNAELGKTRLTPSQVLRLADLYRRTMNRLGLTVEDLLRGSKRRRR